MAVVHLKNRLFLRLPNRLFCIFNRLCDPTELPMLVPERAAYYLLKEIGIPLRSVRESRNVGVGDLTLAELLQIVPDNSKTVVVKKVKMLYDELVRDVIKEGRVRYRPGSSGQEKTKTFTVTSRRLMVRDEVDGDLDQPERAEPTGKVLHRQPLVDAETRVVKGGLLSGNKMFLQVLATSPGKRKRTPALEMVFDVNKDQLELYSWIQAIQEGVYSTQANTNRLDKLYHRLGLGSKARRSQLLLSPPSKTDDQRRVSAPDSPPGFTPPADLDGASGHRPRAATATAFSFDQMNRSVSETHLRIRQPSSSSSETSSISNEEVGENEKKDLPRSSSTTIINIVGEQENDIKVLRKKKPKRRDSSSSSDVGIQLISSSDNVTRVVVKPTGNSSRPNSRSSGVAALAPVARRKARSPSGSSGGSSPAQHNRLQRTYRQAHHLSSSDYSGGSSLEEEVEEEEIQKTETKLKEDDGIWKKNTAVPSPPPARSP